MSNIAAQHSPASSPADENFISSSAKNFKHGYTTKTLANSTGSDIDFSVTSSEEKVTDGKEVSQCCNIIDTDIQKSIVKLLSVCLECNNESLKIDSDLSWNLNFVYTVPTCN